MKYTHSQQSSYKHLIFTNLFLCIFICLFVAGLQSASAAPPSIHLYVDRFDDGTLNSGCLDKEDTNTCQLRGAINLANIGEETDTYHIHLDTGTYILTRAGEDSNNTNGDLDIFNTTTIIEGAGMNETVITQADISQRIFDHRGDKGLKLMNLTVSGGRLASGHGAGIRCDSLGTILTLENVKVTDNRVTGSADTDLGGGIYMFDTYLLVTGSIISANRAEQGAGIYIHNSGDGATATIRKSAIIDNITNGGNGGGLYAGENSRVTLENVTIASNQADLDGMGGGVYLYDNLAADLNHATVANNWASYMGDAIAGEYLVHLDIDNSILYYIYGNDVCYYPTGTTLYISSNSHNITNESGDDWCHIGGLSGTDPLLGSLNFYHSTTQTLPLLTGSPAIDGAIADDPVTTDQRNKPRCDGDGDGTIESDIGAHENCLEFFMPLIQAP